MAVVCCGSMDAQECRSWLLDYCSVPSLFYIRASTQCIVLINYIYETLLERHSTILVIYLTNILNAESRPNIIVARQKKAQQLI